MGITRPSVPVPWPTSTFPGGANLVGDIGGYTVANGAQESGGRLLNVHSEPLGPGAPNQAVWHRDPGLTLFSSTGQAGYRNSILVNNTIYAVFANALVTVDAAGNATLQGSLPGTDWCSLAQTQASPPDVVAVSPANGAYRLTSAGVPIAPVVYNGGGNLPQPNSVTFQDGYLFYGIGDCRVFASPLNSVGTINSLTFITLQAKSSAIGMRVIAFSGQLFCFTDKSCEVWTDAATPAPSFPYSRLQVLEFGLLQTSAISGYQDGFAQLFWVAQDYGVYTLTPGSLAPQKISPPDLDRMIEAHYRDGHQIMAGAHIFAGKRMFTLSHQSSTAPDAAAWTWQFNVTSGQWNERSSFQAGIMTRWRGEGGHGAFGRWLVGDAQATGNLCLIDFENYTELNQPILARLESGAVEAFPGRLRVVRSDFDFVRGVGRVNQAVTCLVTSAGLGPGGQVIMIITIPKVGVINTGDTVQVSGVLGTTEANGNWIVTMLAPTQMVLQGSIFSNTYTSGGTVVDITPPSTVVDPQCSIGWSDDGGVNWKGPILRKLGHQSAGKTYRVSVKNTGMTTDLGRRWRWEVTDPVYVGFMGSTQHSNPRAP